MPKPDETAVEAVAPVVEPVDDTAARDGAAEADNYRRALTHGSAINETPEGE